MPDRFGSCGSNDGVGMTGPQEPLDGPGDPMGGAEGSGCACGAMPTPEMMRNADRHHKSNIALTIVELEDVGDELRAAAEEFLVEYLKAKD